MKRVPDIVVAEDVSVRPFFGWHRQLAVGVAQPQEEGKTDELPPKEHPNFRFVLPPHSLLSLARWRSPTTEEGRRTPAETAPRLEW